MFELETAQLRLIPLPYDTLRLCLKDYAKMEAVLGLNLSQASLDALTRRVITIKLRLMARDEAQTGNSRNYIWYTYWQIVLKQENRAIGMVGFKGVPNKRQEIEVGYGMQPAYQNKGYMTEAARALVDWSLTQETVSTVLAQTKKDNYPSQAVLRKVGMIIWHETDDMIWWKKCA